MVSHHTSNKLFSVSGAATGRFLDVGVVGGVIEGSPSSEAVSTKDAKYCNQDIKFKGKGWYEERQDIIM